MGEEEGMTIDDFFPKSGGEGGIRTRVPISGPTDFESVPV